MKIISEFPLQKCLLSHYSWYKRDSELFTNHSHCSNLPSFVSVETQMDVHIPVKTLN